MRITATQIVKNTNLTTTQNIVRRVITVAQLGARGHGVPADGNDGEILAKDGVIPFATKWIPNTGGGGGSTPDATASVKGKLKLAGDLTGTADLPRVVGLADKQTASQVQDIADAKVSDTDYDAASWNGVTTIAPSKKSVRDQVELLVTNLSAKADAPSYDNSQPTIALINDSGSLFYSDTTTYPSVIELTHLKDVNAPIQGQIDDKQPLTTVLTNTTASFTTADETKLDKYPSTATNGKILQGNGTNYVEVDAPSSGVVPQTGQIIVTSGTTFTVPTGLAITASTVFNIELVGAGGGGAGALNTTSGAKGSAGGGGGYVFKRLTGLTPGNYVCVIGTAGTGSALGVNGNAGTATTLTILGVTYTANGGGGGLTGGTLAGGVGGTAINGDLNYSGQNGGDSLTASAIAPSAKGGDTAKGWGLGGASVRNTIAGSNATGNGGGGSGGHASAGGNGSNGIIFCQWFNQ
jgi:hypothetical protein